MRRLLLAAVLNALATLPARAVDPTPMCVARKLAAGAKTIVQLAACHARAVRRGTAVDAGCIGGAERRFARFYTHLESSYTGRICPDDDGLVRVQSTIRGLVEEAARRLAPSAGGSRCQAAKLAAAGARAAGTMQATAHAFPGSAAPRPVHARARRLVATVARVRHGFESAFARLDRRGGCTTTGDAAAVGAAVDAALDVVSAALDVVGRETVTLQSPVMPSHTPGSPGVAVTNPKLIAQFGPGTFSLNNVTYTRWRLAGPPRAPDAILVTVAGFGGGAGNFEALAENLITRMHEDEGLIVEVWGYDRRTEQLEDRAGILLAGSLRDPLVALDWYYGDDLGLTLHPALAGGPNRRAVFYNTTDDVPFIANWTSLVFSRDIDAVVQAAHALGRGNVFLGGHSAGTGFAARYAATDFNISGTGPPSPGYTRLRGIVLFEGSGGSTATPPLTEDSLDRIIARHDGGLFGAVRDGAPRCVDGATACTVATEAADCAGQMPPKCTPDMAAHGVILGLSPKILASAEPAGVQGLTDPDGGQAILQVDQGAPGINAIAKVPELSLLAILEGLFGYFLDDEGVAAALSPAVAASVGARGPVVNGLATWLDVTERARFPACPGPDCVTPDNGPPPTVLPATFAAGFWGHEKEVTRLDRLRSSFAGVRGANASDWYYPLSGLAVTTAPGVCTAGVCAAGDVGADCVEDADCTQSISLDSTALSVGRGRPDIENLTQAANVDVPVLCIGGSNGLATVPGRFTAFAKSIGTCRAPTCDGTPRVLDDAHPSVAFPTVGGVAGGFEVVIAEGFAHIDVVAAEDDADNPIVSALAAFIARNLR
jgi:pimeloyl-ACP methyl ester carboxylesterase